jgi:phosphoglycerol transferase
MLDMAETRRSLAAYLAAVVLSLVAAAGVLQLWNADWRVPLAYGGDSLCAQLWIKGLIEQGWYLRNESVGAPFGLDMHDFPLVDSLFFLILKLLSRVTPDPFQVINLYFLLTFPLTAVAALFVFRRFGVPRAPALVGCLLFAALPYHFYRGDRHLFLASYFLVPLAVMVCLWVYLDGGILFQYDDPEGRPRLKLRDRKAMTSLVVCLLLGSGGIYYACFTCYLLVVAGCGAAMLRRQVAPLCSAGILIAVIALGALGNVAPKIGYQIRHGPNPYAVRRSPAESELFGMKLVQLLLPVEDHRVGSLARLRRRYDVTQSSARIFGFESKAATLGGLGSLGFLALLGGLLARRHSQSQPLWEALVALNVAAVLLATTAGLGTLLSFVVSPLLRAYARISVFVAFFSFFAMVLALAQVTRSAQSTAARRLVQAGLAVLLVAGLWEQTTPAFVPAYAEVKRDFADDAEFVRRVEASLPPRAMVFQLPMIEFPEATPLGEMCEYDHFRLALHSRTLRWSFGAMRGRYAACWQSHVADQPTGEMVRMLALAGFGGISIDRKGYPNQSAALEAELARHLGVEPVVSRTGRHAFFHLAPYTTALRRTVPAGEWTALSRAARSPVTATWRRGFWGLEIVADGSAWRWCGPDGELILTNPSPQPRRVDLGMTLARFAAEPARVRINGPDGAVENYQVDALGQDLKKSLVIPTGTTRLRIRCDGRPVVAPNDPRTLVFRVTRFSLTEPVVAQRGNGPRAEATAAAAQQAKTKRQ